MILIRKTWEDPEVDVQRLGINADDKILAITSAGDNVLHYAIAANVKTIHAVDMNPCQVRYEHNDMTYVSGTYSGAQARSFTVPRV
jgi:S-adenosylmethionine:diacylglycerol 3-amino-3-carboxypropyl transferase